MTEEEKKAIELLEDIKNSTWCTKYIMSRDSKNAETILNLMQKQQSELEKKDKIIDLMAPQIYLTKEQRREMREYIWTSNKPKDFKSFVKQYFERKAENENRTRRICKN